MKKLSLIMMLVAGVVILTSPASWAPPPPTPPPPPPDGPYFTVTPQIMGTLSGEAGSSAVGKVVITVVNSNEGNDYTWSVTDAPANTSPLGGNVFVFEVE